MAQAARHATAWYNMVQPQHGFTAAAQLHRVTTKGWVSHTTSMQQPMQPPTREAPADGLPQLKVQRVVGRVGQAAQAQQLQPLPVQILPAASMGSS